MRVYVAFLLCFTVVAAVPRSQRIAGGALTTINNHPEIACLLLSNGSAGFWQGCAGTIINNRSILTAAHCTFGSAPAMWQSRVGSSYANSGGVIYRSSYILNHLSFDWRTADNDIAIITTMTAISFTDVIQPATIAGTNYNVADNQIVWAAGWGRTSVDGPLSEQLRHVQIWTVNQALCSIRYAELGYTVTDNMLCSGWLDVGGRDQCQGDSGGPLYHNGVVVGVCSWGEECALPRYPGVNTRVSRYTPWIQANA